jgi:hypothetical protein
MISQPPARSSNARQPRQDVETADVLPGFGPGVVKDENSADNVATSQTWHTSLSEDETKEMVLKYGDISVAAQPWNREGDESASIVHKHGNLPEVNPNSQSNLQPVQIPTPQLPYQQLRRHSMLQYDMPRESQIPLPQAYPGHQNFAMPGHLMHPAGASYYGILGRAVVNLSLLCLTAVESMALGRGADDMEYMVVLCNRQASVLGVVSPFSAYQHQIICI